MAASCPSNNEAAVTILTYDFFSRAYPNRLLKNFNPSSNELRFQATVILCKITTKESENKLSNFQNKKI